MFNWHATLNQPCKMVKNKCFFCYVIIVGFVSSFPIKPTFDGADSRLTIHTWRVGMGGPSYLSRQTGALDRLRSLFDFILITATMSRHHFTSTRLNCISTFDWQKTVRNKEVHIFICGHLLVNIRLWRYKGWQQIFLIFWRHHMDNTTFTLIFDLRYNIHKQRSTNNLILFKWTRNV